MKSKQVIREVFRSNMHGLDGFVIMSSDGDVDKFYPARIRPAQQIGGSDTAEVSTEFFLYIALLQNQGVKVVFKP